MKLAGGIVGTILLLVLIAYLFGRSLPREHASTVSRDLPVPPEAVLARVTAYQDFPKWRKDVQKVEFDAATNTVTEHTGFGPISYRVTEQSPRRMVTTIVADPATSPFGGTWTYEFEPIPTGTRIRITENGFVNPPLMRLMSKYIFGHETTLKKFVTDLAAASASDRSSPGTAR